MPHTYEYPHFALTVDAILLAENKQGLQILLIQRKNSPFKGEWAFPGGYVGIDEALDAAVHRELEEETTVAGINLERFDVFDAVDRDPRERTVSVAYFGFVKIEEVLIKAADDAKDVKWFSISALPELAFDHAHILSALLKKIRP